MRAVLPAVATSTMETRKIAVDMGYPRVCERSPDDATVPAQLRRRLNSDPDESQSNCVGSQVVSAASSLQGVLVFIIALRMVSSFLAHAIRATFLSFPRASSR